MLQTFGSGSDAFSIEFVEIGSPGNVTDSRTYNYWGSTTGSVSYVYNLGKYEISRNQIEKANAGGGLGISLYDMTSLGGNGGNRPATGISWNEAARFVNWLNTSKGYQAAYNFTTSGSNDNIALWSSGAAGYDANNPYRNSLALYVLPSMDEWHKGAYGSSGGTWYDYATGSNSPPSAVSGGTSGAVYGQSSSNPSGPADVTDAGGLSSFGTMAQGGNVWEWTENSYDWWTENSYDLANTSGADERFVRGGGAINTLIDMAATGASYNSPGGTWWDLGFRVAMVPEPGSGALLMVGMSGLMIFCRLRRKAD